MSHHRNLTSGNQVLPDRLVLHSITAFRDVYPTRVIGRFMIKGIIVKAFLLEGICFGMDVADTDLLSA